MAGFEFPRRILWQKCRRGEIQAAAERGGLAVLPTGAVEQHGPHLPLVDPDAAHRASPSNTDRKSRS